MYVTGIYGLVTWTNCILPKPLTKLASGIIASNVDNSLIIGSDKMHVALESSQEI